VTDAPGAPDVDGADGAGDAAEQAPEALPPRERRFPQWPMTLVLGGVAISLVVVATGHFRRGSVLLAATVVLAMFLRLLLREDEAGLLVVRSKLVDVVVLAVLGIGLGVLAFVVPPPP
jgi:hypothetical protein